MSRKKEETIMKEEEKEYGSYGRDQMGAIVPENEPTGLESDMEVFGGMTQEEREAEVDREEEEERKKQFQDNPINS